MYLAEKQRPCWTCFLPGTGRTLIKSGNLFFRGSSVPSSPLSRSSFRLDPAGSATFLFFDCSMGTSIAFLLPPVITDFSIFFLFFGLPDIFFCFLGADDVGE